MYTSFEVKNFRCFQDLKIDGLAFDEIYRFAANAARDREFVLAIA